jgi:dipeptidyl aminopeptidase/acylaminoacyl peptidase
MILLLTLFDRAVGATIAGLLIVTALLIWRGDRVAVQILAVSPPAAAEGVSAQSQIRVQFDQPVLLPPGGPVLSVSPAITGNLRLEGATLVFVPHTPLQAGTAYTVTLDAGLRGQQRGEVLEPYQWHFQVGQSRILYSAIDPAGVEQLHIASFTPGAPSETKALTAEPNGIWDFTVNAAGGDIIYSALTTESGSDLWAFTPGAQSPELLLQCPAAACTDAAFAPSGQLVALTRRSASGLSAPLVSPPRIWLLDLTAAAASSLFADNQQLGFEPRWSNDGRWLSFLSPDMGGVEIYNLDSGERIFYPTTTGEGAVWRPNRLELVLSEMREGNGVYEVHLQRIDPAAGTKLDLSQHEYPVEDNSPAWSPDGEWLAFRRKEIGGPRESMGKQIWRMRADGSDAQPLTLAPEFDHGPISWSPDGRYLLFHKFPLRGPEVVISVWVLDVESGESWEIVRPGQRPKWVP